MGAAQGKEAAEEPSFDVRISNRLFEELEGRPARRVRQEAPAPPAQPRAAEAEEEDVHSLQSVAALHAALRETAHVSELLRKREEEELRTINEVSLELLNLETKTSPPPLACAADAEACQACYEAHAGQPLACSTAVAAFAACSQRALAEV